MLPNWATPEILEQYMPDPTFSNVEEYAGEILHDESQNGLVDEMVGTHVINDKGLSGGVCKALCAKWISSSANAEDFWGTIHNPETRETIRLLQHQESAPAKMLAAAVGTSDKAGHYDKAATNNAALWTHLTDKDNPKYKAAVQEGEKLRDGWASKYIHKETGLAAAPLSGVPPDQLVKTLGQGTGYYLFGFDAPGGGHAMALYNMPGVGVQYFDPNFGEAVFTDPTKFQTWIEKHLGNYASVFGNFSSCKVTFVEKKVTPDRSDMQTWIEENAGPVKPVVPNPVHWPAFESAQAIQKKKELAAKAQQEQQKAAFEAQWAQSAGGRQKRFRPPQDVMASTAVPTATPQPTPTPLPQVQPPVPTADAGSKGTKKSWRRNGGFFNPADLAALNDEQ